MHAHKIRAKFRCMKRSVDWQQHVEIEMKPAYPQCSDEPGGSEENRKFWEATPSGSIRLLFREESIAFVPGDFYYVDVEQDDAGEWVLSTLTEGGSTLGVDLSRHWSDKDPMIDAQFKMHIDNAEAWSAFKGQVNKHWRVAFSPAPASTGTV